AAPARRADSVRRPAGAPRRTPDPDGAAVRARARLAEHRRKTPCDGAGHPATHTKPAEPAG
ncbi:hypothetical protein ACFV17_06715, partial [Streptomyces sp. NPDC059656]